MIFAAFINQVLINQENKSIKRVCAALKISNARKPNGTSEVVRMCSFFDL